MSGGELPDWTSEERRRALAEGRAALPHFGWYVPRYLPPHTSDNQPATTTTTTAAAAGSSSQLEAEVQGGGGAAAAASRFAGTASPAAEEEGAEPPIAAATAASKNFPSLLAVVLSDGWDGAGLETPAAVRARLRAAGLDWTQPSAVEELWAGPPLEATRVPAASDYERLLLDAPQGVQDP